MADYIHVETEVAQSSKRPGMPCGDVIDSHRSDFGTLLVCADGIGSGIKAHIAAQMCVTRLLESVFSGMTFRKAFASVAATMQNSRDPSKPFAAFSFLRVRPDGNATVLSYDSPPPIFIDRHGAQLLGGRPIPLAGGFALECNCQLATSEGILLMSDGITQAGIGYGSKSEWTSEGVVRFVNECIASRLKYSMIPERIHQEAVYRWKGLHEKNSTAIAARAGATTPKKFSPFEPDLKHRATRHVHTVVGDDCSVVLAHCRIGQTVNILTGPPVDRERDMAIIRKFLGTSGLKIVCGGTTAKLVAKALNVPLEMEQEPLSDIAPPRYGIKGINLVTEGAVTLNQVYNIIDEDIANLNDDSGVTEIRLLLNVADRVNIIVGCAQNNANEDISFRQRGVLSRKMLIPLLVDKLERAGKLVNVEYV